MILIKDTFLNLNLNYALFFIKSNSNKDILQPNKYFELANLEIVILSLVICKNAVQEICSIKQQTSC